MIAMQVAVTIAVLHLLKVESLFTFMCFLFLTHIKQLNSTQLNSTPDVNMTNTLFQRTADITWLLQQV